jgi:hypothetical protein
LLTDICSALFTEIQSALLTEIESALLAKIRNVSAEAIADAGRAARFRTFLLAEIIKLSAATKISRDLRKTISLARHCRIQFDT